jgi:hypothetical protein
MAVYDSAYEGNKDLSPRFIKLGKIFKIDVKKIHQQGTEDGYK